MIRRTTQTLHRFTDNFFGDVAGVLALGVMTWAVLHLPATF